uniref:RNA-directed DNA polymerase, eukaryota, reverse transcriptase zinc-binding domain protein n=1 Tax=Tanacetum cinerariifolium TaxID=118510 RepID=A0A6L2L3R1_TANCI|nr:RNA-directed DNA polymerase, eukaryota, reverse transcriptase zinc-binding domain protein [Tanacetum cinerariifolium]
MSYPNHPTSNIKDAFSSNFSDYTTASSGNISPDPPDNLSKYLFASLAISHFHNVQAYKDVANKPPILPQDSITPPTILTLSPVLPPSPLFDPRHFFVPEELLPPKKQIHPPSSSSTTLSNSSRKQSYILVPPSFSTYTPTPTQIYELGKSSIKMRVKHHEKQVESNLSYLEELSFHYIEKMEERLMPPKRTSTSEAPAMTQVAIRKLVADSVTIALKAQVATMANTNNYNRNSGLRRTPIARKCTYEKFMSCQPFYFNGGRGLRQRDLISLYVFTMVMDMLNLLVKDEINKEKAFKYHFGCKQLRITHLCFAGDLIMLCNRHIVSVKTLKKALDKFSAISVYWGSVFLLPKAVINEIEGMFKKFLWNNKDSCKGKAKVACLDLCKPKDQGGLGFKSLELWNRTLLVNHLWNVASRKESLWVKWINMVDNNEIDKKFSTSIVWKDVIGGNGKVSWYKTIWHPNCIPKNTFILWIAVKKRLCTQDKMAKSGRRFVSLPEKFKIDTWENLVEDLSSNQNISNVWIVIRNLCLADAVYCIWQESNMRLF